jgi:hypothetical protein
MTILFVHTGETWFSDDETKHKYFQAVFWYALMMWVDHRRCDGGFSEFLGFLKSNYWEIRREIISDMVWKQYGLTTDGGDVTITVEI